MKKSILLEGWRELELRIWRRRDWVRGMEEGSRLRVPDSEMVLVREAMRSRSPILDRLFVVGGGGVLVRRNFPWRIAGSCFALRNC